MTDYTPVLQRTRGATVESLHYGAAAVVDSAGNLLAFIGSPQTTAFMRSAAKPIQALPFMEHEGDVTYELSDCEIAQICASHAGTDMHVAAV
ncbi:MAG: asparaginase, partial [Anaerolineales bacterium]|nr:asparaginase [Anaerolineales bacterium]